MASGYIVRPNEYYDSVFLMGINKILSAAPGVEQTAVLMGSGANKRLLTDIGIAGKEIDLAGPNDLIVAVIADSLDAVDRVLKNLDHTLASVIAKSPPSDSRTLDAALSRKTNANLAVLSIPGAYIRDEALKALDAGLNVFIFSSNVPQEQELEIKMVADARGLLVMGPDCGTSILNGVGIGFANNVRRGTIGALGPSGTGLQEFTCQVHNAGGGISHAIGTGSNDLSSAIAGLTSLSALAALEIDPATEVIAIIAKPPDFVTLRSILDRVNLIRKPVIGCFLGSEPSLKGGRSPLQWARTIDEAVDLALRVTGVADRRQSEVAEDARVHKLGNVCAGWTADQKFLRGVFAGGTFCYQAQQILGEAGLKVYSNSPIHKGYRLDHPDHSREHTLVDMGDEHYTLGRPHPMIDSTLRAQRILTEARDPTVAILLFDIILGYNASKDPVGELRDALLEAKSLRRKTRGELTLVASVCGTPEDLQDRSLQVKLLEECGVHIFDSGARAAMFCRDLVQVGSTS